MNDTAIIRPNELSTYGFDGGAIPETDATGGILLDSLPVGTVVSVETKNTTYTVTTQGNGEAIIFGHPEYCPEPVSVRGIGATYPSKVFREGYLAPELRFTFPTGGKRVTTSRIVAIQISRAA